MHQSFVTTGPTGFPHRKARVGCPLRMQAALRSTLAHGIFFRGESDFPSADSRRGSSMFLAKECTLNGGRLSPGGLSGKWVTDRSVMTPAVY